MKPLQLIRLLLVAMMVWLSPGCRSHHASSSKPEPQASPEVMKALGFLSSEVPRWHQENQCYSCHNNGDGARALYVGSRLDSNAMKRALADTTDWLREPRDWENNKGDPGFSDKRLARIQFTHALATAVEQGHIRNPNLLRTALMEVVQDQAADGSWPIEPAEAMASPATYGTHLATTLMMRLLDQQSAPAMKVSAQRAREWIRQAPIRNMPDAAAILLASGGTASPQQQRALNFVQRGQTSVGGWGPYPDAPPEIFDTALCVLALKPWWESPEIGRQVQRGVAFLRREQLEDGSWIETTRPSGNVSYAQHISTTGWATLAVMAAEMEGL